MYENLKITELINEGNKVIDRYLDYPFDHPDASDLMQCQRLLKKIIILLIGKAVKYRKKKNHLKLKLSILKRDFAERHKNKANMTYLRDQDQDISNKELLLVQYNEVVNEAESTAEAFKDMSITISQHLKMFFNV